VILNRWTDALVAGLKQHLMRINPFANHERGVFGVVGQSRDESEG